MKILLINHYYYSISQFTTYEKFFDPIPVMGLGYIASTLREAGHEVRILDDYIEMNGIEGILQTIEGFRPETVGLSVLTPLADEAILLAGQIRERFPETSIVMGHRHADYFAELMVTEGHADFVVHGEGEQTFLELVNALENKSDPESVQGITYLSDKTPVRTESRPYIEDLDSIPFPAWDLFPLESYRPCAEVMPGGKRHLPLLISRGCPYDCIFCTQELGGKCRLRSPENVVAEMLWDHERFGVDGLILFDANFPIVRKHAESVCRGMIDARLPEKIKWTTETRPDCVDDDLLHLMKQAGCTKVQIGFESGSDRILETLRKRFTVADSQRATKMIKRAGLGLYGLFVIGCPSETREEIRQTIAFAKSLDLDFAKFNIFVPYPGTPAYEDPEIRDRIGSPPWINFTSYPPTPERVIYTPEGLDAEEMIAWQKRAFLRFYLRPKIVAKQLLKIRHISFEEYWNGLLYFLKSIMDLFLRQTGLSKLVKKIWPTK